MRMPLGSFRSLLENLPDFSDKRLAERLGKHASTVGRWRKGETTPTAEDVNRLEDFLRAEANALHDHLLSVARDREAYRSLVGFDL